MVACEGYRHDGIVTHCTGYDSRIAEISTGNGVVMYDGSGKSSTGHIRVYGGFLYSGCGAKTCVVKCFANRG